MAFSEIPVLDVGDARTPTGPTEAFSHEFTDICHHVGFALVTNHGIGSDLTAAVFDMMHRFFALPVQDKRRIDKTQSPQFRGWEPVGAETTNNAADMREQIDVWTQWPTTTDGPTYQRLLGPNQWLPDEILAGHESLSLQWIDALALLADQLMAALAVGLGLPADHLRNLFGDQPMSLAMSSRMTQIQMATPLRSKRSTARQPTSEPRLLGTTAVPSPSMLTAPISSYPEPISNIWLKVKPH